MSRAIAALAVLVLTWAPAAADARGTAQEGPQEQIEALGRALGMTPEEVEALGLSPAEIDNLLAGFSEETVVVGSRARPRTVTASPVPVDVLSTADLIGQGAVNLQDQLRTVVPGRIPDFPVTRSHPPASWPSAANSSICRTYRKTAGEESRRRSPVANRWMRP